MTNPNTGTPRAVQIPKSVSVLFQSTDNQAPWPRMILCFVGVAVPLLVGMAIDQLPLSIYGALAGYLLALNDHLGKVRHRLWIVTLTFVLLCSGVSLGFALRSHPLQAYIGFACTIYWLGILGGVGAELERGVLFAALGFVLSYYSKNVDASLIPAIFSFSLIAYGSLMAGIPILWLVLKRPEQRFMGLRESFFKSLTLQRRNHIYAVAYCSTAMIALLINDYFQMKRGYWIIVTTLLVMRADSKLSFYITVQRLVGTAIAVTAFVILAQFDPGPYFYAAVAISCALVIPGALPRNYLYASFFITAFILSLLELAIHPGNDSAIAVLRLKATLIGCALSLAGTVGAIGLDRLTREPIDLG